MAKAQKGRSISPYSTQIWAPPTAKMSHRSQRSTICSKGEPSRWFTCIRTMERTIAASTAPKMTEEAGKARAGLSSAGPA